MGEPDGSAFEGISPASPVLRSPGRPLVAPALRRPPHLHVLRIIAACLLLGLLAYSALWMDRLAVSVLGVPAPLALVTLGALIILCLIPLLMVSYQVGLALALARAGTGMKAALMWTGIPQSFSRRVPRLAHFLAARLAPSRATGLGLTIGLFIAGGLLWSVLELLIGVASDSPLVSTDRRTLNLVETLRTPGADSVMYAITYLANGRTILVLTVVVVVIALLAGRGFDALLVTLAVLASNIFIYALKVLVERPRPPLDDARIVQGGFSFPSGHSAIAATFYGTLAYLLIRAVPGRPLRALIAVVAGLLILAIGISRIYLGVHYPSDVLAGWATGALWVILLALADNIWHMHPPRHLPMWRQIATTVASVVLIAAAATGLTLTYGDIPPSPSPAPVSPSIIAPDAVSAVVTQQLPHHSETLFGHHQEPVSIILVGTKAQIERAFRAAGWTEAQPVGTESFAQAVEASIAGRPDPAGPVTPSFLGEEPSALAFSQAVGTTFAKRHHIRLWTTHIQTSEGQPVWLATASFDRGFELAPNSFLPTHQIDPHIDIERELVVKDLQDTGLVARTAMLQLVPPESGHNFAGDPFVTDGQAVVLWLNNV